jgi:predicted amidohydrolase
MLQDELKIALVQADTRFDSIAGNLAHLEEWISAFEPEADIFLLPELFNTGYQKAFSTRPEAMGLQTTRWMKLISQRKKAAICGSFSVNDKGKTFNRMVFACPDGRLQHYDKINVFAFSGEDKVFSPGTDSTVFEFKGWKIKPIICFDLRFPETVRNQFPFYDLMVCAAHWPKPRIEAWDKLLMARAIENQSYLAAVNRFGTEGSAEYPGHSAGIDFLGRLKTPTGEKEEIQLFSIRLSAQNEFRSQFPFLKR